MRHSIALNLSIIVALGSPVALPVSAQGPAAPRRDPVQERVDSRPVEPAVVEPEPELEAHLAFQRTLDEVGAHARREARLTDARRVAPFDLDWGL